MNKKVLVGFIILIVLILGTTYAWWTWNSTTNTDVSLTVDGINVTYDGGTDITGVKLIPVASKEKGIEDNTAILKTVTASSTQTTYMNFYLTLETMPTGLKHESFVYEIYNGTNLVGSGNFKNYNQGDKIKIASEETITSSTTTFKLYIWIDANNNNPTSMMNQDFKFVLSADATDYAPAKQTATKLGITVNNMEVTSFGKMPYVTENELNALCMNAGFESLSSCLTDFFEVSTYSELMETGYVSTVNDNGVFRTEDDLGTSYYYRGNVENNYVYFGGFYWRIMRINGDGTIRIIFDGMTKKLNGTQGEDNIITSVVFNDKYDDNAYAGYMYGTPGSDYTNTHKNENSSTIKVAYDQMYEMIKEQGYDKYLADAIYCNDRKVTPATYLDAQFAGNGTGSSLTSYDSMARMYGTKVSPTLKCSQLEDRFSQTAIGNEDLLNPLGLPTIDELVMSGYTVMNLEQQRILPSISAYSFNMVPFWTMTPSFFIYGAAPVWIAAGGFGIPYYNSEEEAMILGVRPVVSLKSDVTFTSGDGSYATPFVVE